VLGSRQKLNSAGLKWDLKGSDYDLDPYQLVRPEVGPNVGAIEEPTNIFRSVFSAN
jgi:hypothetical protein